MRVFQPLIKGILFGLCCTLLVCAGLVMAGSWLYGQIYAEVNPDVSLLAESRLPQSTKIYSRNGELLYEISGSMKRTAVPLAEISPNFQNAVIAIEDKDFYNHSGISLPSVVRSASVDWQAGAPVSGGSTITQQMVKLRVLTPEKTLARKIAEAVWAREAEKKLGKNKILELYLNSIPLGGNLYGAEAAAESYFGKPAKELTLAQSAYLAAMVNAPTYFNPGGDNRPELDRRKGIILSLMLEQGRVTQSEYRQALSETVAFHAPTQAIVAPHFVMYVKQLLITQFGQNTVENGGLRVYTTLDVQMQKLAEDTVVQELGALTGKYRNHNAGLVALDPHTGEILAMVGSRDYFGTSEPQGCREGKDCVFDPLVNIALSPRQPGSSFKPYVYSAAFDRGNKFFPGSIVRDVRRNFSGPGAKPYIPSNYNHAQYGRVPLRKALAGSLNVATVDLASQVGLAKITETVQNFGLSVNLQPCGLAAALGACEVTLLEHAAGIAGIANMGSYNPPLAILQVADPDGAVLMEAKQQPVQAIDPQAAYEVISIMKDTEARKFIFGKNPPLTLPDREVIAKTGTTQNWKDGWTLGATPDLAAGVWTGNNDGTLMAQGADGVFTAAPIWQKFMTAATAAMPKREFTAPDGITQVAINPYTGAAVQPGQRQVMEIAANYSAPAAPPAVAEPEEPQPVYAFEPAAIVGVTNGETLPASAAIIVSARVDARFGTRASLYVDGTLLSSLPGPDYSWQVPAELMTPGSHTFSLIAVNQAGYQSQDAITVFAAESTP